MNDFDDLSDNVNNDSLLLEDEKSKKKGIHLFNKKFFIFLFVIIVLSVVFQIVRVIMTKSYATYRLVVDIPEYVYMNEPATFTTKFFGDKSDKFTTNYSLSNEYSISLLKSEKTGFNNSNVIIPVQEGETTISISGILNPNSRFFNRTVLTKDYSVMVCPDFNLDLLKFKNVSIVKGSFYNLGIDFGSGKCSEGISYDISNNSIATVNNLGMVTALNVGETNLTISKGNKKIIVPVYVTQAKVLLKTSESNIKKVQLISGEKFRVSFDYTPFNATNVNVRYISSNSSVASVNDKGLVEAKGIGTSTIRVMSEDNNIISETEVVVEDPSDKVEPATKIEVLEEEINLEQGKSKKIQALVVPDGALKSKTKWTTSNKAIITVDNNGIVYARSVGTAYLYITNGDVKKSIIVNVS